MTRQELIEICEAAIVPAPKWADRDTPHSQERVGALWAFLKAGCAFRVMNEPSDKPCITNGRTIWVEVTHESFSSIDAGYEPERETFYLPTRERLAKAAGADWY